MYYTCTSQGVSSQYLKDDNIERSYVFMDVID